MPTLTPEIANAKGEGASTLPQVAALGSNVIEGMIVDFETKLP